VRFTIERIRTMLLAFGVLLIVAIAVFLGVGKWRHSLLHPDIPKRLGINIQQEANGVTYTQAHGGHTIFKIHASRVIELKNDHATLRDVVIELYGRTGTSVDRIRGSEFDYDNKTGTATAAGQVDITLAQPVASPDRNHAANPKASPAAPNQIHVKTSGLVFNQQSGIVTTSERVEFSTAQTAGSAMGASYDSGNDRLVLDRDVELTAHAVAARGRAPAPVQLHAQHAEFDRDDQICYLTQVAASTSSEQATAAHAKVAVRSDGSVENLNATEGFTLTTSAGSHMAAPTADIQFSARNQPLQGRLAGGVTLNSASQDRTMNGSSPTMEVAFGAAGQLRHVHLERGVELASHDVAEPSAGGAETTRTWRSPVADIDFRAARSGKVEPATIRGTGGVVVTTLSRRGNGPAIPSRLAADEVTGQFGPRAVLRSLEGAGRARIEQTAANGAQQIATGDRLLARFVPADVAAQATKRPAAGGHGVLPLSSAQPQGAAQIQSAVLDGHVTLAQQPAPKPGTGPEAPLRASAARAEFEGAGQRLHLTGNPRVNDGGMELTADTLDVAQETGEAVARGNVKATWIENGSGPGAMVPSPSLGGRGPVHAIAEEATFQQSSGEATFRGHARVWQQDNSISGPSIVLDRQKQTLVARTTRGGEPVSVVMLSAPETRSATSQRPGSGRRNGGSAAPAVVRVRGGDLWYSGAERRAILRAAPLAEVTAQSGAVESTSNQVELFLAPAGAASGSPGAAIPAQVERMVASGHVVLTSQGRSGTGEQLAYSSRTGEYTLTGTAAASPRLNDPQRGSVTGTALIFNTRNDSVSIEGHGQETMTETTVPR
jgi:lipopolysaccharide export system protein LptA